MSTYWQYIFLNPFYQKREKWFHNNLTFLLEIRNKYQIEPKIAEGEVIYLRGKQMKKNIDKQ